MPVDPSSHPPALEFPVEFRRFCDSLPDKVLFIGLATTWVALFQFWGNSTFGYVDTPSLFGWLYRAYNAPGSDDSHGNLIPWVVLALFWWKRAALAAVPKQIWAPALTFLLAAVLFHLLGYAVQQPRISVLGFLTGLYGLMGLVWGACWLRASFFPFFLLLFCVPIGSLAEDITFPLRLLVTKLSVGLSHNVLGMDVVRDGTRIFNSTHTFNYDVAPACSGIRSLVALLALTTIYGFVTFGQSWKRAVMILLAMPLAIVGNVVRLLGIILIADAFGHKWGAFVEQKLGFITFLVALAGVVVASHLLRDRQSRLIGQEGRTG
jgi:exosortase